MKTSNKNPILPMEDQPAKPVYIGEQHNHNCQQFYGPVTGCVFAMPGAVVNQYPDGSAKGTLPKKQSENATRNPQLSAETILQYVMKLYPLYISKEWKEKYKELWEAILELPAVADKIHDKGKQQHEYEFNRNLLGNILCLLKLKGVMTNAANATKMAEVLEDNKDSSVRAQLGLLPPDDVKTAIEALVAQKEKEG